MKKICYIIGSGEAGKIYISPYFDNFIIAADGGLRHLDKNGITPDLILGDFDSLGYVPSSKNVIKYKSEKDYTDTFLAIKEGIKAGCSDFILYGCLGGRLDHTIANIQALSFLAEEGRQGYLTGINTAATVIKNSSVYFGSNNLGTISVFCIGGKLAKGVNIKGLKYGLTNASLKSDMAIGISNEFTGDEAEISVSDGKLLIIWNSSAENIIHEQIRPD